MQDASSKEIKLDDKYVVNDEIELEKEMLVLFFQSKNYSGKNGFSLKKVEYSETADYKNPKEISIDEKLKVYEEETKRYKVTIPLDSMQEGKSYYFALSFVADSGQERTVKFRIKIKKSEVVEKPGEVEKPKSKEPTITAISANPPSATPGDEVTLEVKAESPDGGTLSYQWYAVKNNAKEIIEGSNKHRISYTIPGDTADGTTLIFCVKVTNIFQGGEPAEKISDNVTVTVKEIPPEPGMAQKPTLTVLPAERTLKRAPGEKVELYVKASSSIGNNLVFKWEECKDDEWTVVDEQRYTLTVVDSTEHGKVFTMPNEEGWEIRKYRITVTNIIDPPLPDGTENSASRFVEFVVEEEARKPMEYPEVTFDVQVKDENGEIYHIYYDRSRDGLKLGDASLYSGESFTITALAEVSDGGILSYKWQIYDWSSGWKDVEGGNGSSIKGRFDTPSEKDLPHYYVCTVTNTDPEGIKKAVSTRTPYEQLTLVVSNPKEFIFNAGNGQFADGTKEKSFFIKPEILRTKDEEAAQYYFRLEREDFAQWVKEIGMHPDVIWNSTDSSKRGISYGDLEFLGWKYSSQNRFLNWDEESVRADFDSSPTTFEAQWNEEHSLLEKMNTLIRMSFNTVYGSSASVVEAEKAEKVDGKLKVYYDLEIEASKPQENSLYMKICITSNGKKQEFKYGQLYGITDVGVTLNSSGFKSKYDEDYKDYIGNSSLGFNTFMPVKNCMNAGEDDIVKFSGASYLEAHDRRSSASPAGVFVCRYEDGHKYCVQFCFYADAINKTYGIEYFKMNDKDNPSRKCAIYIPCYGIKNKENSKFTISTTSTVGYFSSTNYGSDVIVNRIDFEKEKIYGNIWVENFYNFTYGDTSFNDDTCPLVFAFDVIGISTDGNSFANDNSSKTTYYSVKVVDGDSYTPKSFEEEQTTDRIKAWSLQQSTGKVYELSTKKSDSGESGLEFFMTTTRKYNCSLRFDLTKLPPQFEIFDATESTKP